MSNITIVGFTILVALLLIIASHFFKRRASDGNEPFLFASASIILLVTGLTLIITPISYETGFTEQQITGTNETEVTREYTYTEENSILSYLIGMVLVLVGMFGSVTAIPKIRFTKEREEPIDFND